MSEFSSNSWRTSERNRLNFFRKFSYLLCCCCCWCNLTVCNQYQVDENPLHLHIHFSLSLFAWNFGENYNTWTFLINVIRLLYIVRYFKIISIVNGQCVCVCELYCAATGYSSFKDVPANIFLSHSALTMEKWKLFQYISQHVTHT